MQRRATRAGESNTFAFSCITANLHRIGDGENLQDRSQGPRKLAGDPPKTGGGKPGSGARSLLSNTRLHGRGAVWGRERPSVRSVRPAPAPPGLAGGVAARAPVPSVILPLKKIE